jgi:hypothetical protein
MRVLPFGKNALIQTAVTVLLPLSPLVLTMVPFEELVNRVFKVLI